MGASILYTIVGAIIGGLVTFYFTRKKFEKEIKEIRQIMKSVNANRK